MLDELWRQFAELQVKVLLAKTKPAKRVLTGELETVYEKIQELSRD